MATLQTQTIGDGVEIEFAAASLGGDKCRTGDGVRLLLKNDDAASTTVTIATPGTVDGLAIDDRVVTVAAGKIEAVSVKDLYRDKATGLASITYSSVTDLGVAVVR